MRLIVIFCLWTTPGFAVGPILLMHLNEAENATVFRDSSGSNLDGSCSGASCPTRGSYGIFSPALVFDGTDDFINGMNVGAAGTGDFTISAWVRTTNTSAGVAVTNRNAEPERSLTLHSGFFANAGTANGVAYFSNDGSGCEYGAQGATSIANGNFHHIVGVRSSTNVYTIYVNGTSDGSNNVIAGAGCQSASASATGTWVIGDGPAWGGSEWVGSIAEVAIYNQALTRSEINGLYMRQVNRFEEAHKKWFEMAGYPKFFFSKVFWS